MIEFMNAFEFPEAITLCVFLIIITNMIDDRL